jgi:hypothetical protein
VPTAFVIGIGIIKELLAEVKRYHDDEKFNSLIYERVVPIGHALYSSSRKLQFEQTLLKDLKVGDLIRIRDG